MLLDHHFARRRIDVTERFEVQHVSTAISLVSAGVGAAILPASTLLAGTHPDVLMIALDKPVIHRPLGLIRRRNAALSPAAQAFYDRLVDALAARTASTPVPAKKARRSAIGESAAQP